VYVPTLRTEIAPYTRPVPTDGLPPNSQPPPPPPPQAPTHPQPDTTGALASAVWVISTLTLMSRVAGLARDVVTARLFGDAALASAFRAAYALPNLFRRLFGEGALSAAFLPEYTRLRQTDPRAADGLATATLWLLTLATGILTLVVEAILLTLLLTTSDNPDRTLSFQLMMLMLPLMPAVCITAILGGMLQAHGRFGPTAAAPIILNLFQIAAGSLFTFGILTDRTTTAYAVGVSAVLAGVVQIVWSLHALRGRVHWQRASAKARRRGIRVFRRFIPAMIGLGAIQLNSMIDMIIAMWPLWVGPTVLGIAVTLDEKSNAVLSYVQSLYQFPLGVFGLAVATAVFPLLSRAAPRKDEFAAVLRRGLRLSLFIGLPAAAGLAIVREDLVYVIYSGGRGGFTAEGVQRGAAVLLGFAPGVWAYSLNHVMTRAYYASRNTHTPMRVAMLMVLVNITLNLTLIWPLREAGMAWATAISAMLQVTCLIALAPKHLRVAPLDGPTLRAFARIILATALMAAAVAGASLAFSALASLSDDASWPQRALRLALCVAVGGAVFAGAARLGSFEELRWLFTRPPRGSKATITLE
jgi:putative peptidoglycan lipid II flippase